MRRFLIKKKKIRDGRITLQGSDARHIRNVLRMKPDDGIFLFDGEGMEYSGKIARISKDSIDVSIHRQNSIHAESPVSITLAQAFLKDKKMDSLVRQMTELGICRWVPFFTERSIPKPDHKRVTARQDRWHKIAREASKQCGRGRFPEIVAPMRFDEVAALGCDSDLAIVFWEKATQSIYEVQSQQDIDRPKHLFVMMGPEGGFSDKEINHLDGAGFFVVSLGPRILRAETAALAACSIVQHRFGDMG